MSYINDQQMVKRRHQVRRLTGQEAIEELNKITDKANRQIAKATAHAEHWQEVARALADDNDALRQKVKSLQEALLLIGKAKQLGNAKGIAKEALNA